MKVCFILEHFYPHIGGGETMFKEYTTRLVEMGCEVKVATSNSGGVTGKAFYEGVEVHHFPWRGLYGHPIPNPKDLHEFVEWADVVHAAILPSAPVARYVAKKYHKPCVTTVYEVLGKKWFWVEKNLVKALLFYGFEQFVINHKYTLCHTISLASQRDLETYSKRRQTIVTIYPGIKKKLLNLTSGARAGEASQKSFLYYGRPGKTKGIFVLFDAIKAIAGELPADVKFQFILANDPIKDKQRLLHLVEEHQLTERIQILDSLPEDELIAAIQRAYCVIVPSITEGFGYTAAESCSLGKRIIASDGGSLPEVVSGEALFFQNRNSRDLAEKIRLAVKGDFQFFTKRVFDWENSTKQLLGIYEDLLRQSGKQSARALAQHP
jgi:glycosyltransferase involved in cell wall biosynthesis